MSLRLHLMVLVAYSFAWHPALATMVIDNFTAANHDRFAMGGTSFVGDGLNFSGIGRVENGHTTHSAWATMISSTHFLSASHLHPATNATVYFYPGNDPTAMPMAMTVAGGCSVTDSFMVDGMLETRNTDIWVGEFTQAVPTDVAIYSIPGSVAGNHLDATVFHVGDSVNNQYSGGKRTTDFAVGKNVLDHSIADGVTVSGFTTAATKLYADDRSVASIPTGTQGTNFVEGETRLVGGDSGGPTFIDNGGLELLGIHCYVGTLTGLAADAVLSPLPSEDRYVSGDSYLPHYASDINQIVTSGCIVAVPEPNGLALMGLVAFAALTSATLKMRKAFIQ